jgi:hypothetical protein
MDSPPPSSRRDKRLEIADASLALRGERGARGSGPTGTAVATAELRIPRVSGLSGA